MFQVSNLTNNPNINVVVSKGNIKVLEYIQDLSVMPETAIGVYYASEMNIRKR